MWMQISQWHVESGIRREMVSDLRWVGRCVTPVSLGNSYPLGKQRRDPRSLVHRPRGCDWVPRDVGDDDHLAAGGTPHHEFPEDRRAVFRIQRHSPRRLVFHHDGLLGILGRRPIKLPGVGETAFAIARLNPGQFRIIQIYPLHLSGVCGRHDIGRCGGSELPRLRTP